ncbi:MAG: hypothetical protein LGR52_04740 [Candidatus Thiosymbion ectosymbiont of Robbea hypermnestra]|nr:hypothetical protein [Candidatus Thiosymbion ectosymbiont of Robbea hypermnestra]
MNTDLIVLYKQLDDMKQTEEVLQIKNQIKEVLYQKLKVHFLELTGIGRVIGYEELQTELAKAIELIEVEKEMMR